MAKIKYVVVFLLFGLFIGSIVTVSTKQSPSDSQLSDNFGYIEQMVLGSSRYTQEETVDPAVMSNYEDNFTLSFTQAELDYLGFELILEDDDLKVYFEDMSFSVIILNKQTGYYWSSRPEFQHKGSPEGVAIRNQMNSGIWIEYVRTKNNANEPMIINDRSITTESLYRIAGVAYPNDEFMIANYPECSLGFSTSNICPQITIEGRYDKDKVEVKQLSLTADSLISQINVKEYGFKFNVELSLENGLFKAFIDNSSIEETNDRLSLLGIYLFPYMGATRENSTPGYVMIPDGVGALVRMNSDSNANFQARFFGSDLGYNSTTSSQLNMPIYGMIHEVGANGYYVNITEGAEQSILYATFYGSNSRYNFVRSKFVVRELYDRIINADGLGRPTAPLEKTSLDYELTYTFLSDADASYVGMSIDYREYLTNIGILKAIEEKQTDVKIHLNFLMADTEPAFIGTRTIRMTRISDILSLYENFKNEGINHQMISLHGWSKDGNGVSLARTSLNESRSKYESLSETLKADGNDVYLVNNYVIGNDSKRVNYINDVARNISRIKMTYTNISFTGARSEIDLLYPEKSYQKAEKDQGFYQDLGYGLDLKGAGDMLFSYYDGGIQERTISKNAYQNLAGLFDKLIISNPNMYMWGATSDYLDMPVTNSQYNYYTDLVPILPIVLAGSMEYYTPYLNFNALGKERLLMMIDFGINPSYILTEENTYKMRYTKSNYFYTTQISDYYDEIIEDYHYLNDALKSVRGHYIVDRTVVKLGIVKITYDNNVTIYVNYTDAPYVTGDLILLGQSYEVVL